MVNRAQRRNMAKGKGRSNGRVTPKKDKVPRAFMTVTDGEGKEHRIEMRGEEVSKEEAEAQMAVIERSRQAAAQQVEAATRVRAHVHGLWIPGDPLPGQG